MNKRPFDLILFDLGGVLVELGGIQQLLSWLEGRLTVTEMWERWLSSQTVRAFEAGQTTPQQFAAAMIGEFKLPVSAARFLAEFKQWPKQPFAGAKKLLANLGKQYTLGVLSNTNELHWQRIEVEMGLIPYFDWVLPSHWTGRLKPDIDAFSNVVAVTGHLAERILFFDDNRINTDAAKSIGFNSQLVSGVAGVAEVLKTWGL